MLCLILQEGKGQKKGPSVTAAGVCGGRGKAVLEDVGLCREALFQLCLSGSKFWGEWW